MSRTGFSTSNVLLATPAAVTAAPLTVCCWAIIPSQVGQRLIGIYNSGGLSTVNSISVQTTLGGSVIFAVADGSAASSATSIGIPTNSWFHAAGVYNSATSYSSFLNGGGKNTQTVSRVPSGLNRMAVGAGGGSNISSPSNGSIAEAAIWNIALSDADILALSKGLCPLLMHPEALVAYWPLLGNNSPENNLKSNAAVMNITGSLSKAAHPRIFMPHRRQLLAA